MSTKKGANKSGPNAKSGTDNKSVRSRQPNAGPSSTDKEGEGEDQNADGTKEKGSKNSATENKTSGGKVTKGTSSAQAKGVGAKSPAGQTGPTEAEKKDAERRKGLQQEAHAREQITIVGQSRTALKTLHNSLLTLSSSRTFNTEDDKVARKELAAAHKELDGTLKKANIGDSIPGVTDAPNATGISFDNQATERDKRLIIISQLDEVQGRLQTSSNNVKGGKHHASIGTVLSHLSKARKALLAANEHTDEI